MQCAGLIGLVLIPSVNNALSFGAGTEDFEGLG